MAQGRNIKCVASTGSLYHGTVQESLRREAEALNQAPQEREHDTISAGKESNFFKSAQWSPDGTCILTNSEDNRIRTFVLPPDLLDEETGPHELKPYSIIHAPEPVYATAIYPFFNLQDPNTTIHLSTPRSHPIALHSSLHSTPLLASYPLIHAPTETYITPHSIIWSHDGTHFLTGSDSLIALFDITRNGQGPINTFPTIPSKRKKLVGGGVGIKGIVSALALTSPTTSGEGILAAGTFSRQVGLYANHGTGDCISLFSLPQHAGTGTGITQLLWSSCSRYLYVLERRSTQIQIYDIRVAGKHLCSLEGHAGDTNQRLSGDINSINAPGEVDEIFVAGMDGVIRVWNGPVDGSVGNTDEDELRMIQPTWEWKAGDAAISSTCLHPSLGGGLVASCSGQRRQDWLYEEEDLDSADKNDDGVDNMDNTLKIWSIS